MAGRSDNLSRGNSATSLAGLLAPKAAPAFRPPEDAKPSSRKKTGKSAKKKRKAAKPATPKAKARPKPIATAKAPRVEKPAPSIKVAKPPPPKSAGKLRLDSPKLYLNRELTWLNFNFRVLHEARDKRTPLLERLKFLSIASSNLDEFFMKRIGGLKQQIGAGVKNLTVDGRSPSQQLAQCAEVIKDMQLLKREVYLNLVKELKKQGIVILSYDQASQEDRAFVREYYLNNIFPLVTPLAMDPAHPFPFISNLSLNLLVTLSYPNEQNSVLARVKVPVGGIVSRFLKVGAANTFIPLEDVMAHNLDMLFPDMKVFSCELFRVTRNANTELDEEEAGDLLEMIETELRDRKFAPIVRLQTMKGINPVHRGMLAAELGLDETSDVFESDIMIGLSDLMELTGIDIPAMHYPPHRSINNVGLQEENRNIFHIIRETGSILLQHPYESFNTSVVRFVREASTDAKVQAIKMTLYRTSADTRIIELLIDAARNGKQVAVVVELKARFDEAANIHWASRLEEVGIHVNYGVLGLKTHSKTILVIRKDYSGLRRYAHIGTGNYHAGTARQYFDLGILTCDDDIGKDLSELYNYLTTGCKPSRKYRKLLAAPKVMKKALLSKIDREIALHSKRAPGLIRFKTNALEDADITKALYRASAAGVKVDLIVRDTCRLRPGIPGLSDNVTVVGIVGRFLEHTRIYYFQNGGDEEYFIGSADLMKRNLESRVEIITPIEDAAQSRELGRILEVQMADRLSAWDMRPDGTYIQRHPDGAHAATGSQQALIAAAEKRNTEANRLRKRKPRTIAKRAAR